MPDIIPTRSAFLELREERGSMREGYQFLDEKRLVLAGAILEQLERHERSRRDFDAHYREAVTALRGALERHGLEGLEIYPPLQALREGIVDARRDVLSVPLRAAHLESGNLEAPVAVGSSPEAEHCRQLFRHVLELAVQLAADASSLQRLWWEYRRTARRTRALEDVLLPEIDGSLRRIEAGLEELDREEAIRVRHFKRLQET